MVLRGDIFMDRRSKIEREVRAVWTTRSGELKAEMYGGSGSSTIRVDRLLDERLFIRLRPPER